MANNVEICGVNTSRLPVMKNAETISCIRKAREGDMAARDAAVSANLKLVLSVIQRFSGRGEMMDDLFQIGCVGLIKAVDNFNTEMDVHFSTYAVPMIIGEVRRHLRDKSAIRVSRSMRDLAYRALTLREQMSAELSREPTVEEMAVRLSVRREDLVFALDAIADPVSLFEPVGGEGNDALLVMDQVGDERNCDARWLERLSLAEGISRLSERERRIVAKRFWQGKTQSEVAAEIGISQAQVSRLEKHALETIEKHV
ncbi:MAG: RNA polymerase sporulation sigma factor SigG [Clostridia bacterium]|nr:RNA polymerase sporulation sigma factor SigG [Clostridia bacterium]